MGRISSNINDLKKRVAKLEEKVEKKDREFKDLKAQVDLLTDDRILQMIQETNTPFSNKPRYSYDEIATASGRSTGYISNLAKEHGLSRRNIKAVK